MINRGPYLEDKFNYIRLINEIVGRKRPSEQI